MQHYVFMKNPVVYQYHFYVNNSQIEITKRILQD
jgi:hypothetical protein